MKKTEFYRINQENPYSRIGRRTREEQKVRNHLANLLKKKNKREKEGKQTTKIERKQKELENKKHDMEISDIERIIDSDELTQRDLEYLENLSFPDLSKIDKYRQHWFRSIVHTAGKAGVVISREYPYFPKYVFLYETFKDKSKIIESVKNELYEKAKKEVWEMICAEIENDTILGNWQDTLLKHIFEYIPQKTFADKLIYTGNFRTESCVDVLWHHIDSFTELDDKYKEFVQQRYEYYKKRRSMGY